MPCTNNLVEKTMEVLDQLGANPRPELLELFKRGAFRHREDVAYAVLVLAKKWLTLDELAHELIDSYKEHRCDPIYPA